MLLVVCSVTKIPQDLTLHWRDTRSSSLSTKIPAQESDPSLSFQRAVTKVGTCWASSGQPVSSRLTPSWRVGSASKISAPSISSSSWWLPPIISWLSRSSKSQRLDRVLKILINASVYFYSESKLFLYCIARSCLALNPNFMIAILPHALLNLGILKEYFSVDSIFWMVKATVKILISFESYIIKDSKYLNNFFVVLTIYKLVAPVWMEVRS